MLVLVSTFLIPVFIWFNVVHLILIPNIFLSLYYVTVKHLGQHLILFKRCYINKNDLDLLFII